MTAAQYFTFDPHEFPPVFLEAIGFLSACTAQTEATVEHFIHACVGIDSEFGAAVTAHMNAPMRDQALRAAAEIRILDCDWLDKIDETMDRLGDLLARRNKYIHNLFGLEVKTGLMFFTEITARGSVKSDATPVTTQEIRALAEEIYTIGMTLISFAIRAERLPPLLPEQRNRFDRTKAERKKRRKAANQTG